MIGHWFGSRFALLEGANRRTSSTRFANRFEPGAAAVVGRPSGRWPRTCPETASPLPRSLGSDDDGVIDDAPGAEELRRRVWEPDTSRTCRICGCKSLDEVGHCDRCGWKRDS